eukprot:tig00020563_g11216.t1
MRSSRIAGWVSSASGAGEVEGWGSPPPPPPAAAEPGQLDGVDRKLSQLAHIIDRPMTGHGGASPRRAGRRRSSTLSDGKLNAPEGGEPVPPLVSADPSPSSSATTGSGGGSGSGPLYGRRRGSQAAELGAGREPEPPPRPKSPKQHPSLELGGAQSEDEEEPDELIRAARSFLQGRSSPPPPPPIAASSPVPLPRIRPRPNGVSASGSQRASPSSSSASLLSSRAPSEQFSHELHEIRNRMANSKAWDPKVHHRILEPGVPLNEGSPEGEYKSYRFNVPAHCHRFAIRLRATAGKCVGYVSHSREHPTVEQNQYVLAPDREGEEVLELDNEDPKFRTGSIFIAVYGTDRGGADRCSYELSATHGAFTVLTTAVEVTGECRPGIPAYYRVQCPQAFQSVVFQIGLIEPPGGEPALRDEEKPRAHVSTRYKFPDAVSSVWTDEFVPGTDELVLAIDPSEPQFRAGWYYCAVEGVRPARFRIVAFQRPNPRIRADPRVLKAVTRAVRDGNFEGVAHSRSAVKSLPASTPSVLAGPGAHRPPSPPKRDVAPPPRSMGSMDTGTPLNIDVTAPHPPPPRSEGMGNLNAPPARGGLIRSGGFVYRPAPPAAPQPPPRAGSSPRRTSLPHSPSSLQSLGSPASSRRSSVANSPALSPALGGSSGDVASAPVPPLDSDPGAPSRAGAGSSPRHGRPASLGALRQSPSQGGTAPVWQVSGLIGRLEAKEAEAETRREAREAEAGMRRVLLDSR